MYYLFASSYFPSMVLPLRFVRSGLFQALLGCAALLSFIPQAKAGPSLYANSFIVNESESVCLDSTRKALLRVGFRGGDVEPMTYNDDNGKPVQNGWLASHPTENVSIFFECDARNGKGALAVAGANHDVTYKIYSRLWDIWMK